IGVAEMDGGSASRHHLERALEIAVSANSPEASTILTNLAVEAFFRGDLRREDELFDEAYRTAERFGDLASARFVRGDRIWTRWALGHWDEAAVAADEFIIECEASPHYLESAVRGVRASIRAARGDAEGAVADWQRAAELGRRIADAQSMLPALAAAAHGYGMLGRIDDGKVLAAEAFEAARGNHKAAISLSQINYVARRLGVRQQLLEVLEGAPDTPWKEAAVAGARGELSRAADLYAGFGAPTIEAEARLCAAEELIKAGRRSEGETELHRALDFYRSVGASFHIARGEALFAASA
ncbi:MAG TPA: hypothetical protein VI316_13415, partial [Candidatus Dormibacteraeota bacterium]